MHSEEPAMLEESTSAQPLTVIQAFLDDERFWQGAWFRGVLCDDKGNVVPWEADIVPDESSLYTLSGVVQFDSRPAISVRSFFELWRDTK